MRIVKTTNCLLVGLTLVCGRANAEFIYDNGPYSELGGTDVSFSIAADDFVPGRLPIGVSFVLRDDDSTPWDQSRLDWFLFNDWGGAPGDLVGVEEVSHFHVTSLGPSIIPNKTLFEVWFLTGPLFCDTTPCWFGLSTRGVSSRTEWLQSETTTGFTSVTGELGSWSQSPGDLNFKLVTAPPTWPFIGLAVVAECVRRRATGSRKRHGDERRRVSLNVAARTSS
jgi:hypothetical protein